MSPSPSRLVSVLWPIDMDEGGGDLTTAPWDHEQAWCEVQRLDRSVVCYAFDHFPRGRLEFFSPGRRWLLFVDAKLKRGVFIAHLVTHWCLPTGHVTVAVDRAYSSSASVRGPR